MVNTYEEIVECLVAVIRFTLETEDGLLFLRCWDEGNFGAIRKEWPDAPEEVFWADPLYKEKIKRRHHELHSL